MANDASKTTFVMPEAWLLFQPGLMAAGSSVGTSYTFWVSVLSGLLLSYLNVSVPVSVSNTVYIVCAHAVVGITIAVTKRSVAASHLNCVSFFFILYFIYYFVIAKLSYFECP